MLEPQYHPLPILQYLHKKLIIDGRPVQVRGYQGAHNCSETKNFKNILLWAFSVRDFHFHPGFKFFCSPLSLSPRFHFFCSPLSLSSSPVPACNPEKGGGTRSVTPFVKIAWSVDGDHHQWWWSIIIINSVRVNIINDHRWGLTSIIVSTELFQVQLNLSGGMGSINKHLNTVSGGIMIHTI